MPPVVTGGGLIAHGPGLVNAEDDFGHGTVSRQFKGGEARPTAGRACASRVAAPERG
jgi:hypothetical protein